ncbi:MAG TPA: DUF2298 domain-containing protein [candidate division Zixibacteria bacterium]|nr:DUF2298 domain-containing protein [candidate division Zixibacteria bacterium]
MAPERSPAAALLVAAGVAAALLAAWLVPPLAIGVVWPLLFAVPGWALVALARPRIGSTGRLGLAIVLSVAVSAHLVYWLSLAVGYERWTVFTVAALLALPLPLAAWFGGLGRRGLLAAQAAAAWGALRRERVAFALAGFAAAFVGLVLDAGLWRPTETGIAAGGSNWSDLGVHLSIAQSLNAANFPPQVPYFAGAPLVYHWFADFHAAIAARAAGLFAVPAFSVSSAILAGALALLVHGLARRLLRGPRARRAALLAAVLVIFSGGLGWIRWVSDIVQGFGDPIGLMVNNSYDNYWFDVHGQSPWPYFRIPSVMGTGLLVHRATTAGLPMLVGAMLLLASGLPTRAMVRRGYRDRPLLIGLTGLLGALLAPFHFFFFPAVLLLALLYVLLGGRLFDLRAPENAFTFLAPYLLAVPFASAALRNSTGSGSLKLVAGWESAPMADGPAAVVFFYVTNLGVPFLLAVAALLVPRTPWRAFLAAWAAALFLIPNLVQVSDIAFDMNKYFQAMWIAVALLAAWLIRRWPWPAVAVVLLLSVPSPLLVSGWTAFNRAQVMDYFGLEAADWIAENTPEDAVFATDGWLNSPTDPAGRLRLLTFAPYVANLGFEPEERVRQVRAMYCAGNPALTVELMRQLEATYLLESGRPADCRTPTDFAAAEGLEKVFDNGPIRIWRRTDATAGQGAAPIIEG